MPRGAPGEADYIVVGGGSAGAVLAARLSERPDVSVLLLEAGGGGRSPLVALPAGYAKIVTDPKFDWNYEQEPDRSIDGRSWIWSAGRMLGGSSSLNGQVFIRGTRHDYDEWAALGATGWSFDEVLPFFLRSEDWRGPPSQVHGTRGPLTVSPQRDPHPLADTFLRACRETGLPTLDDYNDGSNFGAFLTQTNQRDGWRCSTEKAFLRPARRRANLTVVTDAEVTRLLLEGQAVTGVEYLIGGAARVATARREVVLSAGVIGTPALLMRSGIGPADHLRERGIAVACDAPGVGANLQEHSAAGISRYVSVPTLNTQMGPLDMVGHLVRFALGRRGALTTPAAQAMALARTRPELAEPDVQLHFTPVAGSFGAETRSPAAITLAKEAAMTIYASICKPQARGRVRLGADRRPRIQHELASDPHDLATLVGGMRLVTRIFDAPALASVTLGPRSPATTPSDDEGWIAYIRRNAIITWHAVGTCRMGSDEAAVVDPHLRFRGIERLRIVDASVMPTTPSSNTNAPTIMIAEKAAAAILSD